MKSKKPKTYSKELLSHLAAMRHERPPSKDDSYNTFLSYMLFNVSIPLALTLTCPVTTADVAARNPLVVIEALLWTAICSAAFWGVYKTEPGYLTKEHMDSIEVELSESRQKRTRKFCRFCRFSPPLRAHHCHHCGRCVATFEHHCEYMGTCIGERNRAQFLWFLAMNEIALLRAFFAVCHASSDGVPGLANVQLVRVAGAKTYLCILVVGCSLLFCSQLFNALTNSTSFEWRFHKSLGYMLGNHPLRIPFSTGSIMGNLRAYGCFSYPEHWAPTVWDPPCVPSQKKMAAQDER